MMLGVRDIRLWVFAGVCIMMMGCAVDKVIPKHGLPEGFVFLTDIDPTLIESVRYKTSNNFLGRPVTGYDVQSKIVCTYKAAQCLKKAHDALKKHGYTMVVYDGYRPQRAVNDFKAWSVDLANQTAKALYYPTLDKRDLFKLGYLAARSSHSRGSTFDLTLIKQGQTLQEIIPIQRQLTNGDTVLYLDDGTIDMGASFDLFHEVSHHDSPLGYGHTFGYARSSS